jgi:hypothetical protein
MSSADDPQPSHSISLEVQDGDSPWFVEIVSRLVSATAARYSLPAIGVHRIDHWFGPRWLGFCGKIFGAGVRCRTLKRDLCPPPFQPKRMTHSHYYRTGSEGWYLSYQYRPPEGFQRHYPSWMNVDMTLSNNILRAWYSGNTWSTRKGVLMVYLSTKAGTRAVTKAWYVMFDGYAKWRSMQQIGISRREVVELIEAAREPATN